MTTTSSDDPSLNETAHNTTADEVARFSALADKWWDQDGAFRPLHQLNPVRLEYIRDHVCAQFGLDSRSMQPLDGLTVLDVGCGGGLIAEPLSRMGATVTAIDAASQNIEAARAHAARDNLSIDYRDEPAERLAERGEQFDVVISLEVIEHVADLPAFIATCASLARPGGVLFFATLNRTALSWLLGIAAAEYVLRWLPRGTHTWKKFVRPSELVKMMRASQLVPGDMTGVSYDPVAGSWRTSNSLAVNYMTYASRPIEKNGNDQAS
jgi:2-polyprenyl-6-hydroxyphenyl methylase / 3-demethylubiquinone-9 3-methyltransferase